MKVTQMQIAEAAGVSRGTVDRALNNRGRIDPQVAESIRKLAEEMGYRRNVAGRSLALSKNTMKIGVVVQSSDTPFIKLLLEGVKAAAEEVRSYGSDVVRKVIKTLDPTAAASAIDELLEEECTALAIMPSEDRLFLEKIRSVRESGIPVITFNSDIDEKLRQCFVGQDPFKSGRTAAGLMGEMLPYGASVLIMSGYPTNWSHRNRVAGFFSTLSDIRPDITELSVHYISDDNVLAEQKTLEALSKLAPEETLGIYLAASGLEGAVAAIHGTDSTGRVKLISTDLTDINIRMLREGEVNFLIGQDAYSQGYEPVMLLFRQLFEGEAPRTEPIFTEVSIKTKYSI